MLATLDGLFDNAAEAPAFCRFPARYAWLAKTLEIDPTRIPRPPPCPEVDNILRAIDGQSVAMVFASGYVNSPASMFGHTFLRIDSRLKSPLLSFAVNYAARTDPADGGLTFTVKGMFGGYQGFYSVMPYYDKVREYSNIDQRDLWEYSLNLTPDEVRRLLLHLIELKDIPTDYFFLDENCSYELLFLVDAARPEARLTETMDRYWVIPMDTVRAVIGAGLVDNLVWRPSRALRIRHARSLLPDRESDLAVEIVDGKVPRRDRPLRADPRRDEGPNAGPRRAAGAVPDREEGDGAQGVPGAVPRDPVRQDAARPRGGGGGASHRFPHLRKTGIEAPAPTSAAGGGGAKDSWRQGSARPTTTTPIPRRGTPRGH